MDKKEFTKKQLKKQLTTLTEGKADIKSELKKAYKALKSLKSLLVGHKTGDQTLSFSDLKKIKTAGKMYNALQGVREGKVVKIDEGTLKRIVERVVTENEDWMRGVDKDIEKKGTKGVFHTWCDDQGYDGGCDKKCWVAAIEEGGVWIKRAGLAKAFCESR